MITVDNTCTFKGFESHVNSPPWGLLFKLLWMWVCVQFEFVFLFEFVLVTASQALY